MPRIEFAQASPRPGIWPLAPSDDARSTYLARLPQGTGLEFAAGQRHELFLVRGQAEVSGSELRAGDYLAFSGTRRLKAHAKGATVLVYSQAEPAERPPHLVAASARVWRAGRVAGVDICELEVRPHRTALVKWRIGAHVPSHDHMGGEELYILRGRLRTDDRVLMTRDWIRMYPGAAHTLTAETRTLVLLRNGHLVANPVHRGGRPERPRLDANQTTDGA